MQKGKMAIKINLQDFTLHAATIQRFYYTYIIIKIITIMTGCIFTLNK